MLGIVIVIAILIGVGVFVWRDWSVIASHNKAHIATINALVTKIADPAPAAPASPAAPTTPAKP